jgi:hypothetical protein
MEKPYWDAEFLAPLVNGSLGINNLLADSVLHTNPDSSLKIVYTNSIYDLATSTLFTIPDTNNHQAFGVFDTITLHAGQSIPITPTTLTTYNLPNVQLRKVIIKSGKVRYKITSKIQHATVFNYSIPCATLGGTAFSINVTVPGAIGSTPGVYNQEFDLSGYTIDLTGPSHNLINTFYTNQLINISSDGGSVLVHPTDSLTIDNNFYSIVPYYALGYFGETVVNVGPATSDFSLFKRIVSGTLNLENVNINMNIENPVGVDARIFVNNLSSVNSRTGTTVNLINSSLIGPPININRASESGGVIYATNANFPLTPLNSNIVQFIDNLPDKFGYSMNVNINPLGNVSGSNDFIYSDKLMKATLNMEIPLSLVAHNLTLVDTLATNLSTTTGAQNVKSGTITLFANNGFPFDASLQIYLLSDHNTITDSIFSYINTIDEAPINTALRATGKKLTKLVVPISESKMSLIYNTKRLAFKVKFNTSAQPSYIKIYSDYRIDVNLVGDINYSVHLN